MAVKLIFCIFLLALVKRVYSQDWVTSIVEGIAAGQDPHIPINSEIGYVHGQCGVHLTQYQIPVGPDNFYSIDAVIKDANGDIIGNIDRTTATARIDISSKLPYTLAVTTVLPGSVPNTDAEPVQFGYGAELWNSGDENRCSVGGYDSGARRMDCGFVC